MVERRLAAVPAVVGRLIRFQPVPRVIDGDGE